MAFWLNILPTFRPNRRALMGRCAMSKRVKGEEFKGLAISRRLILPRLIRLRDISHYLGMDPNRFNAEVRPYLIEIPIGKQGIAFDRIDLDAWVDAYKHRYGRPANAIRTKQGSQSSKIRKQQIDKEYEEALEKAMSRRRTSP